MNNMAAFEVTTSTAIVMAKTSGYLGAVIFFEYLNIPTEQLGILATIMLIDFVTGVGKQYRVDPRELKSHIAWLGAMKKIATLMSVLSVALILKGLGIGEGRYVASILGIFIMAEGYSTIQNVYAIRTGKILPEFDAISILIKGIGEFFKEKIESAVKVKLKEAVDSVDTKK